MTGCPCSCLRSLIARNLYEAIGSMSAFAGKPEGLPLPSAGVQHLARTQRSACGCPRMMIDELRAIVHAVVAERVDDCPRCVRHAVHVMHPVEQGANEIWRWPW